MASENVFLTDCRSNSAHNSLESVQNSSETTKIRKRRSFVTEDLDRVERDKKLEELISEKVRDQLQKRENEFLDALKERDDAISLLRIELTAKTVGPRSESLSTVKSTVRKLPERTDSMRGRGSQRLGSSRVITRNVQVSRSLFNSEVKKDLRDKRVGEGCASMQKPRIVPKANGNVVKDETDGGEVGTETKCGDATTNAAHLRRLTDEHAKLQAEYARIRTVLQTARIQLPVGLGPISSASDVVFVDSESKESSKQGADESEKVAIRREVLRLKEELLAAHQKMNVHLEGRNAALEELQQLRKDSQLKDAEIKRFDQETSDLESELRRCRSKLTEARESRDALQSKLKDAEKEAIEMKEFLQEEHKYLSDGLREAEERATNHRKTVDKLRLDLVSKEDHCDVLSQVVEKTQARVALLETELKDTQDGARQLLLKQGEELSSFMVGLRELRSYVESLNSRSAPSTLVQAILEAAESEEETEIEQDDESFSSQLMVIRWNVDKLEKKHKYYVKSLEKTNIERNEFEEKLNILTTRSKEMETKLESSVRDLRISETDNERLKSCVDETRDKLRKNWCNITETVDEKLEIKDLKAMLTKAQKCISQLRAENVDLVKQMDEIVAKLTTDDKNQNFQNYTALCRQVSSLRSRLVEKEEEVEDRTMKYERHSKVLKDNLGKAEAEVRRLDTVIDHVLMTFNKVADVVRTNDELKQLWHDLNGKIDDESSNK